MICVEYMCEIDVGDEVGIDVGVDVGMHAGIAV